LPIAPPVGDEIDNNLLFHDVINQTVGLEEDLSILLIAECEKLFGRRAACRLDSKAVGDRKDSTERMFGATLSAETTTYLLNKKLVRWDENEF